MFTLKVKYFHNYVMVGVREILFWPPVVYTAYKYPESPWRVYTQLDFIPPLPNELEDVHAGF